MSVPPQPNEGKTPEEPIQPILNPLGSTSTTSIFVAEVTDDRIFYFDPEPAHGYEYQVGVGPLVVGIVVPTQDGYLLDALELLIGTDRYALSPDIFLDFASLGFTNGVSSFSITGINWTEILSLDPFVVGLQFVGDGTLALSQTPLSHHVPEPHILWLLLAALAGAGMSRRNPR